MLGPIDLWSWGDGGAPERGRAADYSGPSVRVTNASSEETDVQPMIIDGQEVEARRILVNNSHLVRVLLERYDATANDYEPWEGASGVAVALCSDRQGDTVISGCGPFSLTEVGDGYYYYVVPASVTALLDVDAYRGRMVFQRIVAGASSEVKRVTPLIVTEPGFTE